MKINFASKKRREPDAENGAKVSYGPAKRAKASIRFTLILLVVLSPAIYLLYKFIKTEFLVIAPGYMTMEPDIIHSPLTGYIADILVAPGETIKAGQSLLQLRDPVLEAEIAFLQKELGQLRRPPDLLKLNNEINQILTDSSSVRANLLKRIKHLRKRTGELDSQSLPILQMALIENEYIKAQSTNLQAKADYLIELRNQQVLLLAGPVANERRALGLQLATAQARQQQLNPVAAQPGTVLATHVTRNERVTTGQPLLTVSTRLEPFVRAYLKPLFSDYAQVGQPVSIRLPSEHSLRGEISQNTTVATRLPEQLRKPFEGNMAALQLTIRILDPELLPASFEGIPVTVRFSQELIP